MFTTSSWLVSVAIAGLAIVILAPLHTLLLLDLVLDPVQAWIFGQGARMEIFSILVDSTDVIFLATLLGLTIRLKGEWKSGIRAIPYFRLWLLVGLVSSVAYLFAPARQEFLVGVGPGRVAYQLFRYCWKPILFYPTAALLLSTQRKAGKALMVLTLVGDFAALIAISQGYSGIQSSGPYATRNSLAGVLIVPFLISVAALVSPSSKKKSFFFLCSMGLLGRALLFGRSRGAFVAVLLGTACLLLVASFRAGSRARLLRVVASSVAGVFFLFLIKPDVLERPTVQRFTTTFSPKEQETFRWRTEERWSFYYAKVKQRPWFGYGTDVDVSLTRQTASTPHNGYLSVAMYSGIPVLLGYLIFAAMSLRRAARLLMHSTRSMTTFLALAIGAGITGILCHNLVESTLTSTFLVGKTFWLLAALALSLPKAEEQGTHLKRSSISMR